MPKSKDPILLSKIFALKESGKSTDVIAEQLGTCPETIRRYARSTEYRSLAYELAKSNLDLLKNQILLTDQVVTATLKLKDKKGNPSKAAISMAKALATTQTAKLLGTKPNSKEEGEEDPKESKDDLIEKIMKNFSRN